MKIIKFLLLLFLWNSIHPQAFSQNGKPNLIVIHTDEHNFRTLGCYRQILSDDQAYVWGEGVEVKTPNIDRLALEGVLCNNFYASSPVCTPSRASMVSGMYPIATGSYRNDIPLKDDVVTFAKVLKKKGYATSYLGKWHLDGEAKPGFAPERKFGFDDNRYMFNRGHWKILGEEDGIPKVMDKEIGLKNATKENFTTDFLTSRALEILERDKGKPFCMMISLPDPHTPNTVRPPYDTMYEGLYFEKPKTLKTPLSEMPHWAGLGPGQLVNELEQPKMQGYFGMVKCIDDNVGRILDFLDENDLSENTIVVFTSDHGDLMGEHHKHNKGNPYEASAKIPFVLRYPQKIIPGKVIRKAFTTTDFAPTILSIMGFSPMKGVHGLDASADFISKEKEVIDDRITYMTASHGTWIASVSNRYKLVLSVSEKPWLIDLEKDPDEEINFYDDPGYRKVARKMQKELLKLAERYDDPALNQAGRSLVYE